MAIACAPSANAGELVERLELKSGTTLTGHSKAVEDGHLRWELAPGEELLVPVEWIERVQLVPETPPAPASPTTAPITDEETPTAWIDHFPLARTVADWYEGLGGVATLWTQRIQIGGTFAEGNTKTDLLDIVSAFERNTPLQSRQIDAGGQWARSGTKQTANRWFVNTNFDWPLEEGSQWITFLTSKNEYNELQNLDYRGTVSTGLGHRFVFEAKKRLITRVGPAYTVEIFHSPNNWRESPDMFGELEVRWPVFEKASFEQKMRVQPSLLNWELVRVFSTTGLLMDLDQKERWKLRLGFNYTYNSQPNDGRLPSDYLTTLSLVYIRK
ncbi:MAG TPA: DUF481 domain-containing protein [Planctomycetaceae bacterium]|nr:DUF481 domain-containing protein [Planctomycetaceae bacterium]